MIDRLHTLLQNPRIGPILIGRALNRVYHTCGGQQSCNPNGTNVLDEAWDNLVILDACRFDFFKDYADELPGRLESITSIGSGTPEFIRGTFSGRHENDLVYVTANPWWEFLSEEIQSEVHGFVNLEQYDCQDNVFDVELPDQVADFALDVAEDYPNKRLLVHFNQPHHPHIGPTGLSLFGPGSGNSLLYDASQANPARSDLRRSYRENLEAAIPEVERLINELPGKTVVTADHGEMLKDRNSPIPFIDYGHDPGLYLPELVDVPWFIGEFEERKKITAEENEQIRRNERAARERLTKLGYID